MSSSKNLRRVQDLNLWTVIRRHGLASRSITTLATLQTYIRFVDEEGVEPSPLARHGSEPCAYASSATRPFPD